MNTLKKIKKYLCNKICPKKKIREVVLVFPYNTQDDTLFLIQEHIHHYDRAFWKFVSGGIDKSGKDNLTHAIEELAEEVGMYSDNIYHFHSFEPIFGARVIHCYIAEDPVLMEVPPENPDTDIITDSKWVNEERLWQMIDNKDLIWNESAMVAIQVVRKFNKK